MTEPGAVAARAKTIEVLRVMAAAVWVSGGVILLIKGTSLWAEAAALRPRDPWLWFAIAGGFMLGAVKIIFIFDRACRKNLDRIAALEQPRWWQFYRPGFFVFLALMVLLGATLSKSAHESFGLLIGVTTLDLSLATALLVSSRLFWRVSSVSNDGT